MPSASRSWRMLALEGQTMRLLANLIGGRLYVSDVSNHRVLVFDPR